MNENPFSEPDDSERTVLRSRAAFSPASPAHTSTRPPRPMAPPIAPRLASEADELPHVGRSVMTAAAAPLLELLGLLASGAVNGSRAAASADEVRQRAVRALQTFESECRSAGVSAEQLRAGHYALCAALDDTALATPWGQSSNWSGQTLSSTFHNDVRAGSRFFGMLGELQKEPGLYVQALEICYFCLALGMRGQYRLDARGSAELDRIREGLYQVLVRQGAPVERELSPNWKGIDAPHRSPDHDVPAWVLMVVAASLLALAYVFIAYRVNATGDALQQRMVRLPPAQLPTIQRDAPIVPPAAAPAAAPDLIARMRKFLDKEIADGDVEVLGDPQQLLVRVMAAGMFESGSATIEPRFIDLLQRIGQALRSESGAVVVLGHTDNQPIRTVRFPSNFQLSAARASAAREALVAATGQPDRITSAGRADTHPLNGNKTTAERERNRRIEIVLTRSEGR